MTQDEFRRLYAAHAPAVCAYLARRVARDDVDDLAAETFAVAWRKLPGRIDDPLPWLYAVARRVVLGHRRRAAGRSRLVGRLAALPARPVDPPDPVEIGDAALADALAQLSEREREALLLVAWEELDNERAARAAGCSKATFAVRLSRARAKMRAALPANPAPATEESLA